MLDLTALEAIVFTRLKAGFSSEIKEKYDGLEFTTEEESTAEPSFPNVYMFLMDSPETGSTLEGDSFSGGLFTFQVKVTDNLNSRRTKEVMKEVLRVMKSMRFQMTATPVYENTKESYCSTARFRRAIAEDDTL